MTRLLVGWWLAGLAFGLTALTGIDTVARLATVVARDTTSVWPWIRLLIAVAVVGAVGLAVTVHHMENNR